MKTNNTKPIGLFLCICCFGYAKAQGFVNSSGGNAFGKSDSASYSLGKAVFTNGSAGQIIVY